MLNTSTWFYRAVTTLVVVTICWTPSLLTISSSEALARLISYSVSVAHAEDRILTGAEAGRAFGRDQVGQFSAPTLDNGQMSFPDAGESIKVDELYPDSNVDSASDTDDLESLFGDEADFQEAGQSASERLTDENSTTGAAYRVLLKQTQLTRPDLANDPVFDKTDEVQKNIDIIGAGFSDCSVETQFHDETIKTHVPDLRQCERIPQDGDCTLTHKYDPAEAASIRQIGGEDGISTCGPGCVDMWIGRVGDNYWEGSCSIFESTSNFVLQHPEAVESATLTRAKYDDYMQVYLNNEKIWQGPNDNFPPETGGQCELDTSWDQTPNVDVTEQFRKKGPIDFLIRVSVTGEGEGYGRIRLRYDPSKIDAGDTWTPKSCAIKASSANDGFCAPPQYTCTSRIDVEPGDCKIVEGNVLCPDMLSPPPFEGGDSFCLEYRVTTDCDFNKGEMACWTDAQGVEHCPTNEGGAVSSCEKYEKDPNCGFVSENCVEGAQGESGNCYVSDETWDCGYDADVPTVSSDTSYTCEGEIRCMGDECASPNKEQNKDFARAAAALQAAEAVRQDATCEPVEGAEQANAMNCEIFKGEAYECKKAVGGYVDCCETPDGVSMGDYLMLMFNTHQAMTTSLASTSLGGTAVSGAWETLRQPYQTGWDGVTSAWSSIKGGFSNAFDTLTGSSTAAASEGAKTGVIAGAKQALMKKTAQWTADAFGPQAANALFVQAGGSAAGSGAIGANGQVAEGATVQLGGAVGTALSGIMLAYTIYSVTKLLIQIIYACEEEEFELGAKRELKSCHHVGSYCASKFLGVCIEKRQSYCCFNSPLSRIIQEQARPQLEIGWGDKKEPDCRPLTTSQISGIDWDKINLDEWLGILQGNGHWPDSSTLNAEALTGLGSPLSTGDRESVIERTHNRIDGIDIQGRRHEASGDLIDEIGAQPAPDIPFTSE